MSKSARYVVVGIFVMLVLLVVLLVLIYINNDSSLRQSLAGKTSGSLVNSSVNYEVVSEDENVTFVPNNTIQLVRYGSDFGARATILIAQPTLGEADVPEKIDWVKAQKVKFVYKPGLDGIVLAEGVSGPQFVFSVKKSLLGREAVVYFDFKSIENMPEGEQLNRALSVALVQLLYRVTHYLPNAEYDYEVLEGVLDEVTDNHLVLVEKN